jgi:hypothetical protein
MQFLTAYCTLDGDGSITADTHRQAIIKPTMTQIRVQRVGTTNCDWLASATSASLHQGYQANSPMPASIVAVPPANCKRWLCRASVRANHVTPAM